MTALYKLLADAHLPDTECGIRTGHVADGERGARYRSDLRPVEQEFPAGFAINQS
jgi:hypothetical protein